MSYNHSWDFTESPTSEVSKTNNVTNIYGRNFSSFPKISELSERFDVVILAVLENIF